MFDGRYHRRDLTTPREVRNALVYVLQNGMKHGATNRLDAFSSAPFFDGWSTPATLEVERLRAEIGPDDTPPAVAATGWLLRIAWRRHGLIAAYERPTVSGRARSSRNA